MKEESFVLVSLKEENAKKIAQAISNETCRKILDYLAKHKATETELSEKLSIPLSTVHYNLQQLVESKLVEANEFHYSKKGKEVTHYSLINKYIIIAPRDEDSIFKKLKNILPSAIVGFVSAAGLYFYSFLQKQSVFSLGVNEFATKDVVLDDATVPLSGEVATTQLSKSTEQVVEPIKDSVADQIMIPSTYGDFALWFFLGVCVTVLTFVISTFLISKLKKQ